MSQEAPASLKEHLPEEQAVPERKFPTTLEELHIEVATSLSHLLSVPDNVRLLAQSMFTAAGVSLKNSNRIDNAIESRPVLSRTEYPNCARGTVKLVPGEVVEYQVTLEQRNVDGEWGPLLHETAIQDALKRLVLSQPTFDGDVWYVTTTADVNLAQDAIVDQMLGQQGQ